MYIPTSSTPLRPMIWDALSRAGRRVAVIGMPPGYPPPRVNGVYVSDFLTPDGATDWASPPTEVPQLRNVAGGSFFDVSFRVNDLPAVARDLFEMTRRRWRVVRHLWAREPWDFFAVHEIGPDRLHHAFWKFFDPTHPRFEANAELGRVAGDYYALLDDEVGRFLDMIGNDAAVLVVSDHGSQAMAGCFCVNEWLIQEGLLRLKRPPARLGVSLEEAEVDWTHTQVWGAGGYYARLFFNIEGREPLGTVALEQVAPLIDRLRHGLEGVRTPDGALLGVRLFAPAEVYAEVRGDPPDLMAYFGNLRWRSAGTVGHPSLFTTENDTGPDDAVHSFDGIFAFWDPDAPSGRRLPPQSIQSVGPMLYHYFGLPIPEFVKVPGIDLGRPNRLR
jgi:predicted AlkP superfamily phosphohydrolase/phosphomutase